MSRIFIDRPIFAWVLAIVVMLGGLGALFSLPIEQYPDIAPTQVNIRASYHGASAETIENSSVSFAASGGLRPASTASTWRWLTRST